MSQHNEKPKTHQFAGTNARGEIVSSTRSASASTEAHRAEAPQNVRVFVLTVSDTRTPETDSGGALIREILQNARHEIVGSQIVRDDTNSIADAVRNAINGLSDAEAVLVSGGSGISARDNTPEALRPLLDKELPGFGEVFRVLSYAEIGAATMLSRAFAGVIGRTILFVLPGSPNAIRLALEKLIVPELGHFVREIRPERRQ